jgi:predicted lipoprotein with Yx(FWY)xxD motif
MQRRTHAPMMPTSRRRRSPTPPRPSAAMSHPMRRCRQMRAPAIQCRETQPPSEVDAGVEPDESTPPSASTTDSEGAPDAASIPPLPDVLDASTPLDASTAAGEFDAGWPLEPSCVYQSPPVPPAPILDAGADAGDAGPPPGPHVQILSSPYLGPYLADYAGYSLYIYTADFPGDCQSPPISTCYDDCAEAWPIFDAGARELVEALDPTVFGSFMRDDGTQQTTYYGWPLYYYKKDLEPLVTLGQGKGKIWFLAEQVLPNLIQMRAPEAAGGVKYLADGRGHTLYAYDGDGIGTDSHPPRVECVSECLNGVVPFAVRSLRAVTTLEPDDLSIFVRPTEGQQVSFRGQALYLSDADTRSGDMNGLLRDGFRLVEP